MASGRILESRKVSCTDNHRMGELHEGTGEAGWQQLTVVPSWPACDFHHQDSRRTWMLWFTQGLRFTQMKDNGYSSIARTITESWAGDSKLS